MYRPFPLFIGLRYTRARRRNHFISFITVISLLGIVLGVTGISALHEANGSFETTIATMGATLAAFAILAIFRRGR